MSGESNVTSGAPGSPSHHHKHKTHWHKFWKVARWVNPIGTAIDINSEHQKEQRDKEQQAFENAENEVNVESDTPYIDSPKVRSGYKIKEVIPQVHTEVFYEDNDWDGHITYRKLLDRIYGPRGLDGKPPESPPFVPANMPHAILVDSEAAPVVASLMAKPGFWDDVACELKGGKGCHSELAEIVSHPEFTEQHATQILNVFDEIRKGLTKAADKLDHAEDKVLGIDK